MATSRILSVMIALAMILCLVTINSSVAGDKEKLKATGTSVTVKFEKIDISDEEGHIIAIFENKQVWFTEGTDEKSTAISRGIMDFNAKTGKGTLSGYSVRTYKNGEKWFSRYEGKPAGKGRWEGTHTYHGGTGKYEGMTGSGTWKTQSLARGIAIMEAEGERIYK